MDKRLKLKAPFPYFGGKSKIAGRVWECLGAVDRYIEPFFGSGAVLLNRPDWTEGKCEIVNDKDAMIANAWRAIKYMPGDVLAMSSMWPVNHADLLARRKWICDNRESIGKTVMSDPEFFDARAASWWIYVMCLSIGGFTANKKSIPQLHHQTGAMGMSEDDARAMMDALSERMRNVRVVCGDWSQVLGGNWQDDGATCGVFLDPPYSTDLGREKECYAVDDMGGVVSSKVRDWCAKKGSRPNMRIVLCGYDSEHDALLEHGWRSEAWTANGCWPTRADDETVTRSMVNRKRERLWISPHCDDRQSTLF